ncbi:MAG: DUF4332 domain-containing protein [Pseudomonadota bacterium]|nr:DUF4332 domain-containing protein [Pseudomonadota bacterium]
MAGITEIEGIGEAQGAKLQAAGIKTVEALLEQCCGKSARAKLAEETGISEKLILSWVNRADLTRIKGVSTQYADLLEASGVDTVPELKMRKPENLHAKMAEVNEAKKLVRQVPGLSQVESWVEQAKTLEKKVTH